MYSLIYLAVSEDGTAILLIRKKECKSAITEIASKPKNYLDCNIKAVEIRIENNTCIETQAAMHVCNVTKCVIVFVNAGNHTDYLIHELEYDDVFYRSKVQGKLTNFSEHYFAKSVFLKNTTIKC